MSEDWIPCARIMPRRSDPDVSYPHIRCGLDERDVMSSLGMIGSPSLFSSFEQGGKSHG